MWLFCATAWGASVDEDRLAQLRDEIAPLVETAVGRRLAERPPVRIEKEAAVIARFQEAHRKELVASGLPEAAADAQASDLTHALVDHALAVYDDETRRIAVVEEHVERWMADGHVPEDQLEQVCACVLAHELTHALQQQYAPYPDEEGGDVLTLRRAVQEGQANIAANMACVGRRATAWRLLEEGSPTDQQGLGEAPVKSSAFLYDHGRAWVSDLWLREGNEAVWAALTKPPTHAAVEVRVKALRSDPWWGPWVHEEVLALLGGPRAGTAERLPLFALVRRLSPELPLGSVPASRAGMFWRGVAGGGKATFGVWSLDTPGGADKWIARRAGELSKIVAGGGARLLTESNLTLSGARMGQLRGFSPGLFFRTAKDAYAEMWVADDRHVVALATTGVKLKAGALAKAMAATMARLPSPTAEPLPTAAGVPSERTPLAWSWWGSQASGRGVAKDWKACSAYADHVHASDGPAARRFVGTVAYTCAVEADDLVRADRIAAEVGVPGDTAPASRINHANLLVQASRPAEALALLDGWAPEDSEHRRLAADIRMFAAHRARSWGTLATFARATEATPQNRAWAAVELARAGRRDLARPILDETCRLLEAKERAQCEAVRGQIGR